MLLKDIAIKLREDERPKGVKCLPSQLHVHDLTPATLSGHGETVYISGPDGCCFGKLQRELLEYLYLRQRKNDLLQILDCIQDGIIAVDADGRIFYLNPAYTRILNVAPRKILGRRIQDVEPGSLLAQTLLTHKATEDGARMVASLNRYVSTRIFPLFEGTAFTGAAALFRDLTELHDLNSEMEKMTSIVGEYSKQLMNLSTVRSMGIITQDRAYLNTLDQAAVVARTDVPVLIRGENGVGKEVLANYIHQCSARKDFPLITVNCAAIPAELLESELFGYEEGSFTGALKGGMKGKFELADKGTIFLDEIGDMPLTMQSKLLRVIQSGELEKVGRQKNLKVDTRIIAATNQPLDQLIEEKLFRQDLYFRLNTFTLCIPPLRERPGDIILLADHFVKHFNHKYHKSMRPSAEAYARLQRQSWPGNVRQLQGCVERAVILEEERLLFDPLPQAAPLPPAAQPEALPPGSLHELLWAYEDQLLRQALSESSGSRAQAIQRLGLSRRTFYRKCAEHGLTREL